MKLVTKKIKVRPPYSPIRRIIGSTVDRMTTEIDSSVRWPVVQHVRDVLAPTRWHGGFYSDETGD